MKKVKLGQVCKVVSGATPKSACPEYWNGNIPWITPAEIEEDTCYIFDTARHLSDNGFASASLHMLPVNTVLLTTRAPIGKVAIVGREMCCNQGFKNLVCSEDVNPKYLYYFLKYSTPRLQEMGRGATFKELSKKNVESFEMPLPNPTVQKKAASDLECVEDKKRNASLLLGKLDELVKSRFVEMFGDPGINERGLPTDKLVNLGSLERGKSKHRPRNAPELRGGPNGPYPLVQTGDVTNAGLYLTEYSDTYTELGLRQSRMWDKGTLCITIAANIAQTSILAFEACFPDSVVGFIPGNRVTNVFLHYWFSFFQGILEAQAPQAAQKNINLKILSGLDVIVPPMDEQEEFAAFVRQVDKLKFETQQAIEKLQILYDSLAQEYFALD